jgi:hypothetical protein
MRIVIFFNTPRFPAVVTNLRVVTEELLEPGENQPLISKASIREIKLMTDKEVQQMMTNVK